MKHINSFSRWLSRAAFAAAGLVGAGMIGSVAWADQVSIANPDAPNAPPQVYPNITVVGVENGKMAFQMEGGNQISKDLARVVDLHLDDEKALNEAGEAVATGNFDTAVTAYNRALQSTNKAWLKVWILPHLIDAANKAGKFDAAVAAFITLVEQDPQAAKQHQPTVPKPGSAYLDPAVPKLNTAIEAADNKSKPILLGLLLEVQKARQDPAAVEAVAQKLGGAAVSTGDSTAVMANAAMGDAKLTLAREALKNGAFDKALAIINESKAIYTTAAQQADALYVIAQAMEGKAAAANDTDGLKDAAIAYLRIVANFKAVEGTPRVVDALMQAAVVMEKLKQNKEALDTYQSVVKDYPKSPRADEANQQIARLKELPDKAGQP